MKKNSKTKKMNILVAITFILVAASLYFLNQTKEPEQPLMSKMDQIKLGSQVFATSCAPCHGEQGIGENTQFIKGGAKIGGGYWAPALNGTAHSWHHPPKMIWEIVKYGSMAQDSPMRGFNGKLSESEMKAVIVYVQSLWPVKIQERYKLMHQPK